MKDIKFLEEITTIPGGSGNETLVRKSICQPLTRKQSKQEILEYEQAQLAKGGFAGYWSKIFKNLTGKKSLTEKAGINANKKAEETKKTV